MKKYSLVLVVSILIVSMNVGSEAKNNQSNKSQRSQLETVIHNSNMAHRSSVAPSHVKHTATNVVFQRPNSRQKMLRMFDANHDGKITPEERRQMRLARHKRRNI